MNLIEVYGKVTGVAGTAMLGVQGNLGVDIVGRIPEGPPEQTIGLLFFGGAAGLVYTLYDELTGE